MDGRFEGSYLGRDASLADDARMECKICWWVYDPAQGDDVWQIPPGTPFSALPEHWRCPVCDGARDQFMVLDARHEPCLNPAAQLESLFRQIADTRMQGIPILNPALQVQAIGFRQWDGPHGLLWVGVLLTPGS
jgi:rubredoxin